MGIRTKLQEMRLERLVGVGSVVGEVEGDLRVRGGEYELESVFSRPGRLRSKVARLTPGIFLSTAEERMSVDPSQTGRFERTVLLEEGDLAQIKRTTHRGAATPHRESRDPADDFPDREAGEMRLLLDEFRRKPRRRAQRSLDGHSAVLR